MKRVAVSAGDLNGIGIELILREHRAASGIVEPVYIVDRTMLAQAAELLGITIPDDMETIRPDSEIFTIEPGLISVASGEYSFSSFRYAVKLAETGEVDGVCTMPIHKTAWKKAGIKYRGHTDALRDIFKREAIMMLGCPEMYVGLFTEHIPLKSVAAQIKYEKLKRFLMDFWRETGAEKIAVLGLNPHAGDNGVMGNEELTIKKAIDDANTELSSARDIELSPFTGPHVPDTAFTPASRKKYIYYVSMYHDQGLIPLKALHFSESINVSLNLPILRTSVDHGTAFDIAYKKEVVPDSSSYLNALRYIARYKR